MFKKTRRKIVATIMLILVLILAGTLAVIYLSSYYAMSEQNRKMLSDHTAMFPDNKHIDRFSEENPPPDKNKPHFSDPRRFNLSTFYSVSFSHDGKVLDIRNDKPDVYSNKELEEIAKEVFSENSNTGIKNNLLYSKADKGDYILVAFMDNTIFNDNMKTLFKHTLIFGGCALIVLFFVSVFLAKKIIRPVEESYEKQKQFISDAGHELKTPISVISANSELLARETGNNQWLSNIQYENERMATLVKQLLELAKTEDVKYESELIDLSRLVCGEVLPFESLAFEKGIDIDCEITDDLFVKGNTTQLKQLISILIDNAIKHNEGSDKIKLSLTKERSFAKLSVINGGLPIPFEQKQHLFERFYRIDTVRNSEDGSYGLGLSIAQAIAHSHSGKIEVHCYNGLVEFKITLPHA